MLMIKKKVLWSDVLNRRQVSQQCEQHPPRYLLMPKQRESLWYWGTEPQQLATLNLEHPLVAILKKNSTKNIF